MRRQDLSHAFKRTPCVNNLPPLRIIPADRQTLQSNPQPSPSGLWWFLDQLTPQERRLVNDAAHGIEMVITIRWLYSQHPELALEALQH